MNNEQRYFDALAKIARQYETSAQIRKSAGKYGCSHLEELEMSYENMQEVAKMAIRGRRRPQPCLGK
jgi:hypothetical protein